MALRIEQFTCRSDNFGVLVHDSERNETLVIDAPEERPILEALERTGWKPTLLLITHHHIDHVEANLALKQRFGMPIVGPEAEKDRIPGIDRTVRQGDGVKFADVRIRVIDTPGHTAGHVSYHMAEAGIAFTGDTLFALGCGRLMECEPAVMFESLGKLRRLPRQTVVYCGHEYTAANARFARTVDPTNEALKKRAAEVEAMRAEGKATLPTTLGDEIDTNPFLRWDDPAIRAELGMQDARDSEVFAEIRRRKDDF